MSEKTEEEIIKNWKGHISKPIVSIVCSVYNHEQYIADALDSFLMQETSFPFEIILGEDASTDGSKKIIIEYQKKYPNIIKPIFRTENIGYHQNWLTIINDSESKYIANCDGDDYWTDSMKLQKQVDFLEINHDYVLCITPALRINEKKEHLSLLIPLDYDTHDLILGNVSIPTCSAVFRHIDLKEALTYDVVSADLLLWHFLGLHGKSKCLCDIGYSVYRVHSAGIWSGGNAIGNYNNAKHFNSLIDGQLRKVYGDDMEIMKKHDSILFNKMFFPIFIESIKQWDLKTFSFLMKELKLFPYLQTREVLKLLCINVLKRFYMFLGLDKIKSFLKNK